MGIGARANNSARFIQRDVIALEWLTDKAAVKCDLVSRRIHSGSKLGDNFAIYLDAAFGDPRFA